MTKLVAYLDDSEDLRLLFSELIYDRLAISVCTFSKFSEMEAASAEVLRTKLIILDINLGVGEPTGIDAYNWLRQNGYKGRIFFLTGHAQNDPRVIAALETGTKVLEKPIKTQILLSEVKSVIEG